MTRTRKFFAGAGLTYTYQAIVMLTGLWLTPFLLHRVGQHDYGIWLVGLQFLGYVTLMDFGVVALLPRDTAFAVGRAGGVGAASDLPGITGRTTRVALYQTPLVILAVILIRLALPASAAAARGPVTICLGVFALTFPLRIFHAVLTGVQDFGFLGRLQIVTWFAGTVLMAVGAAEGFGLYALAAGWSFTQLATAGACAFRLGRRYPLIFPWPLPALPGKTAVQMLGRGFWVSLSQVAQILLNGTDVLIIGKSLGAEAVVPYSCTGKLVSVLANQPQIVMQAAAPGLSEIRAGAPRDTVVRVVTSLTLAMLVLSGLVAVVVIGINQGFVSWWVGRNQYGGYALNACLVATMLLRHLNTTVVYSIFAFGYERRITVMSLIDGVVTLASSWFLVHRLGPVGAPIGSIVGVCLVSIPGNLTALSREIEMPILSWCAKLMSWFWRFSVVTACAMAVSFLWVPQGPFALAGAGAVIVALYSGAVVPSLVRSPLWNYLPGRIRNLFQFGRGEAQTAAAR